MTAGSDRSAAGVVVEGLSVVGQDGRALAPLGLVLAPGERVAIELDVAGDASRLLAAVAGRGVAAGGRTVVAGDPVGSDARPDQVGYLSYEHRLIGTLTAAENLAVLLLGGPQSGGRQGDLRDDGGGLGRRVEQQLAALDLAPATWHNLVEQLSGGQQQRVALARALIAMPRLLVLEDPTSELDPASAEVVMRALDEASASGTCCVLTSTDDLLLASCDREVFLRDGRWYAPRRGRRSETRRAGG